MAADQQGPSLSRFSQLRSPCIESSVTFVNFPSRWLDAASMGRLAGRYGRISSVPNQIAVFRDRVTRQRVLLRVNEGRMRERGSD